jgi:uncharacterized protein (TIGR00255 family)
MKSMTGFGRGTAKADGVTYTAEISSVNHRYLDVGIRLPNYLMQFQGKVRKIIDAKVLRGHVEVNIFINHSAGCKTVLIDEKVARDYFFALNRLKELLEIEECVSYDDLLRFPDIIKVSERKGTDQAALEAAVTAAVANLSRARATEGARIKKDIVMRVNRLKKMLARIVKASKESIAMNKKRLRCKMKDVLKNGRLDEKRLCSEISYIAEKSDVSEELTRLDSHLKEFLTITRSNGSVGRKLDFLIQELMREINTASSKVNDSQISHTAVEFKEEMEKIREQVQNAE